MAAATNGSYVDLGSPASLKFTEDFTVTAWINPSDGSGGNPRIFSYGADCGYELLTGESTSTRHFGVNLACVKFSAAPAFPEGEWHFVAVLRSGNTANIFVNGTFISSNTVSAVPEITGNLNLGRKSTIDPLETRTYWGGAIDELRFYDRALSESELNALYLLEPIELGPEILSLPRDAEVKLSEVAAFSVQARGKGPLRYQWRFNGARIVGATGPELVLGNVSALAEGEYTVEVTDDQGTAVSDPARLILFRDSDGDGLSDSFEKGVGRYELIASGPVTWREAKGDAEKQGGHLATIINQTEWDSIVDVMGDFYEGLSVWLGGTDEVVEGVWNWTTGEPWGFTRWAGAEPDNLDDQDYALLIGNGLWNDYSASIRQGHYLLERGFYTDPTDPDSDDDGFDDGVEYEAGTIPTDPTSRPVPKIVEPPRYAEAKLGESATFYVEVSGKGTLRFQWRFNGARIVGATEAELVVENVSALDEGEYTVEIIDDYGTTLSEPAILAIFRDSDNDGLSDNFESGIGRYAVIPGSFTWHGAQADAEMRGGHLATVMSEVEWQAILSIVGPNLKTYETWIGATDEEVEGVWRWVTDEPWSYAQWGAGEPNDSGDEDYLEIIPRDQSWNDIPTRGAENYAIQYLFERGYYTDPSNQDSDGDGFDDGIEYEAGTFPNDPNSRPVPILLSQPQGGNLIVGGTINLSVQGNGFGPLSFQWRKNGTAIPNAIGATLTTANAQHEHSGSYDVVLSNTAGSVVSAEAIVRVTPVIDVQRLDNGFVILQLLDSRQLSWEVESSENLETWQNLGTMTFNDGQGVFLDATTDGKSRRFYRVLAP